MQRDGSWTTALAMCWRSRSWTTWPMTGLSAGTGSGTRHMFATTKAAPLETWKRCFSPCRTTSSSDACRPLILAKAARGRSGAADGLRGGCPHQPPLRRPSSCRPGRWSSSKLCTACGRITGCWPQTSRSFRMCRSPAGMHRSCQTPKEGAPSITPPTLSPKALQTSSSRPTLRRSPGCTPWRRPQATALHQQAAALWRQNTTTSRTLCTHTLTGRPPPP
mmetsp:Transcript_13056/g.33536  ORF Transcript_13056/g.33536 Transcript_13056/m.33536 type:complete len:220 (+) Transcript_13056:814-1473(+)